MLYAQFMLANLRRGCVSQETYADFRHLVNWLSYPVSTLELVLRGLVKTACNTVHTCSGVHTSRYVNSFS